MNGIPYWTACVLQLFGTVLVFFSCEHTSITWQYSFLCINLALICFVGTSYQVKKLSEHEGILDLEDNHPGAEVERIQRQKTFNRLFVGFILFDILYLLVKNIKCGDLFEFVDSSITYVLNAWIVHKGRFRYLQVNLSTLLFLSLSTGGYIFQKVVIQQTPLSKSEVEVTFNAFNVPISLLLYEISQDARFPFNPYRHTSLMEEDERNEQPRYNLCGCFLVIKILKQIHYNLPNDLTPSGIYRCLFIVISLLEILVTWLLVVFQVE